MRVTSCRCAVERWLAAAKLTQYKSKIKSMGIKCISDFAEMEVLLLGCPASLMQLFSPHPNQDEDIEAIGFKNKFDRKRFLNALASVPGAAAFSESAAQGGGAVAGSGQPQFEPVGRQCLLPTADPHSRSVL